MSIAAQRPSRPPPDERELLDLARRSIPCDGALLITGSKRTSAGTIPETLVQPAEIFLQRLRDQSDRAACPLEIEAGHCFGFPVIAQGELLGALFLFRPPSQPAWGPVDVERGSCMATQIALSLENARLNEALEVKTLELLAMRSRLAGAERLAIAARFAQAVVHEIGNPLCALALSVADLQYYSAQVSALWRDLSTRASQEDGAPFQQLIATRAKAMQEIPAIIEDVAEGTRRMGEMSTSFASIVEVRAPERAPASVSLREIVDLGIALAAPMRREVRLEPGVWSGQVYVSPEDVAEAVTKLVISLDAVEERRGAILIGASMSGDQGTISIYDPDWSPDEDERDSAFEPALTLPRQGPRTLTLDVSRAVALLLATRNGGLASALADERGGTRFEIVLPTVSH